jgi:hypothetical protein
MNGSLFTRKETVLKVLKLRECNGSTSFGDVLIRTFKEKFALPEFTNQRAVKLVRWICGSESAFLRDIVVRQNYWLPVIFLIMCSLNSTMPAP